MKFNGRQNEDDIDRYMVKTPYGDGLIVKTRKDKNNYSKATHPIQEVRLLDFEIAANKHGRRIKKPAMLYTTAELDTIKPSVGNDVMTLYGRGIILEIYTEAASDSASCCKYLVELTSWVLAGRSRVKLYLFAPHLRVLEKKRLAQMSAVERVEFAKRQKLSAGVNFGKKDYRGALNIYASAVDAVRYVQHDTNSGNECRADLLEVMVTCSNNAATCCVQLGMWIEATRFAKNALVLLEALFNKRGMKIHGIMIKNDLCDTKVFGEWRVKSYLVIAKCFMERKEFSDAISTLKTTKNIISMYSTGEEAKKAENDTSIQTSLMRLKFQEKERKKILARCIEQKKVLLKKEKARAQAMFGGETGTNGNDAKTNTTKGLSQKSEVNGDAKQHISSNISSKESNTSSSQENEKEEIKKGNEHSPSSETKGIFKKNSPDSKEPIRRKSVTFSNELEEQYILDDDDSCNGDDAFLNEHKEAFIVMTFCALAAFSFILLRRK